MTSPAIVLVAPTGERNIGAAARIMKNFGISDLRLVRPEASHLSRESRRMAMKADDILESAQVFPRLRDALDGCSLCVATTARSRTLKRDLEAMPDLFEDLRGSKLSRKRVAFVFGTEESGLSNEDLEHCSRLMCIPSNPDYASLNLSQAVALVCYEWSRLREGGSELVSLPPGTQTNPITAPGRAQLLGSLEAFLESIGFINARTRNARMRRLMDVFDRARLSDSDGRFVAALFHFVRTKRH